MKLPTRRAFFRILCLAFSGLASADALLSRGVCGKLPIVHPKQENQPLFRLSCVSSAEGAEQVQLLMEGEKPLVLPDVGGEAFASGNASFDPASVSVLLLQGQPNLYWIRYSYWSSGVGGETIDSERHWVVQKGNVERTVFDTLTEATETNRSGNYRSTTADVMIDYRGSTLRVTKTSFQGDAFSNIEHESDEPGYQEPSRTDALVKTTREIDAVSGRVISEKKRWANHNNSYLVLDDGIAAWLLVTRKEFNLVKWKHGAMFPRNQLPDPENIREIPSIAACWLYNRIPWNQANATRIRLPAPPDQITPNHFVPDHCCNIEKSTNGKKVFLYETVNLDEFGHGKPGRLLAKFDTATKTCYSAQLGLM